MQSFWSGSRAVFRQISRSSLVRDASVLASGAFLSQLVLFLGAPLFLTLYQPADFGLYTFTYSTTALIATLGTWRMERLIVVVPTRSMAIRLLAALVSLTAVTALVLLVAIALGWGIAARLSLEIPSQWALMWSAPLTVFILITTMGLRSYAMRVGRFKVVSVAQVTRAVIFVSGTALTPLVWTPPAGHGALVMVLWQLAADLGALAIQLWILPWNVHRLVFRPRLRRNLATLRTHRKTIGALALSQIVCSGNQQIPISTIMFAFGATEAGWYSLAGSLVYAPCRVVSAAVSDVFNQRVSRLHAERKPFSWLVLRATIAMAAIGLIPFVLIRELGPLFVSYVAGPQWQSASHSIAMMAIASYMFFISQPASNVALIVEARRYIVLWHLIRMVNFLVIGAAAALGHLSYSSWLALFVAVESVLYLLDTVVPYLFARNAEPGKAETSGKEETAHA